jgi:hypothetical protein
VPAPIKPRFTVFVIAGPGSTVVDALSRALSSSVAIRLMRSLRGVELHEQTDLVVVDLTSNPAAVTAPDAQVLPLANLLLAISEAPVDSRWLAIAAHPGVRTVYCGSGPKGSGVRQLTRAVTSAIHELPLSDFSQLVLDGEPLLCPLEGLVRIICQGPWDVRRPNALAMAAGLPLRTVRQECRKLGFTRIEHFIVCVRAVAYEQLIAQKHVPPSVAARATGFDDWSNARRQIRRAREGSRKAVKQLRCLMA